MNKDIVPELLEKIVNEYKRQVKKNKFITTFHKRLENRTAKDSEVSLYGNELGDCASKAFLKYVVPDNLPEGKLYWNIAERIIETLLKDVYERVNNAAEVVQKTKDESGNINIKPQHAPFPKGKIHGLIDKAIEVFEEGYKT